jgi:hypothetical protein
MGDEEKATRAELRVWWFGQKIPISQIPQIPDPPPCEPDIWNDDWWAWYVRQPKPGLRKIEELAAGLQAETDAEQQKGKRDRLG